MELAPLCILVHGFTGSPAEIMPLADTLREMGYEVATPLLAGHEGTRESLRSATASAWLQSVRPLVADAVEGREVHLIGFSMGALLCAVLADEYPVTSLTMLAPAVYYLRSKPLFRQIANLIKASKDWSGSGRDTVKMRLDRIAQTPLESIKHFRRMVQMGKAALPRLELPVCIIQGEQDEIVEPSSAEYVFNTIQSEDKEVHYVPESGHLLCLDVDAEVVDELVLDFLARVRASHTPTAPSANHG